MELENTQAQMRKGILEYCILQIISNGPCYSSDILESLKNVKIIVVEGTLYPLLTRLKNAEILQYKWEESKSGPPRKYFELTEKGRTFLISLQNTWNDLSFAVQTITQINKNTQTHE